MEQRDDQLNRSPHAAGILEESNESFRLLVEGIADYAIYMLDPTGHIVSWNSGAQLIKGYTKSEVIGQHFSLFFTSEDRASGKPDRLLALAVREGKYQEEAWRVRKDGSLFWANILITPLYDARGALRGFGKVTRDTTERRQAQEALRQSEERFRLLVEGVRDYAIFMLDPTGHIVSWNSGAQLIKGYTAAEIIGRHFSTAAEGRFEELARPV